MPAGESGVFDTGVLIVAADRTAIDLFRTSEEGSAPSLEFARSDGAVVYRFPNGAVLPSRLTTPPISGLRGTDPETTLASGTLSVSLQEEMATRPVPLPAGAWLLAAGLGALAASRRLG